MCLFRYCCALGQNMTLRLIYLFDGLFLLLLEKHDFLAFCWGECCDWGQLFVRFLLDRVLLKALHNYLRVPCQRGF